MIADRLSHKGYRKDGVDQSASARRCSGGTWLRPNRCRRDVGRDLARLQDRVAGPCGAGSDVPGR